MGQSGAASYARFSAVPNLGSFGGRRVHQRRPFDAQITKPQARRGRLETGTVSPWYRLALVIGERGLFEGGLYMCRATEATFVPPEDSGTGPRCWSRALSFVRSVGVAQRGLLPEGHV